MQSPALILNQSEAPGSAAWSAIETGAGGETLPRSENRSSGPVRTVACCITTAETFARYCTLHQANPVKKKMPHNKEKKAARRFARHHTRARKPPHRRSNKRQTCHKSGGTEAQEVAMYQAGTGVAACTPASASRAKIRRAIS